MNPFRLVPVLAVFLPALSFAQVLTVQSVTASPTPLHPREHMAVTQRSEEQQARDWGLRTEEWARYRQLMQGPLGIHSPNLDPLTALGIEARNDEERTPDARAGP